MLKKNTTLEELELSLCGVGACKPRVLGDALTENFLLNSCFRASVARFCVRLRDKAARAFLWHWRRRILARHTSVSLPGVLFVVRSGQPPAWASTCVTDNHGDRGGPWRIQPALCL